MSNILVMAFVVLIVMGSGILLQLFLSKQKNKWLGLVIPALHLIIAFIGSFGLMAYDGQIFPILIVFFMLSIPAIVHLLIYFAVRGKMKASHNDELDKMNIQDL